MGTYPVSVVLVTAGLLLCGGAFVAWQRRTAPSANLFALTAGAVGANALAIAIGIALALPRTVILASVIVVGLVLPVPWLLFSFKYTGRNELVSLRVAGAVAAIPVLGLSATALIFGSRLVPWLVLPSREAASGFVGVFVVFLTMTQWLALLYAGGLILAGSAILLWTFHRYEHLDSTLGTLLGIFGTVPWLSILFGLQVSGIEPLALPGAVAVGSVIGGVAAGGSLGRYHLFRSVPAAGNVGPVTVIEELDDVMVVTDSEETIIEINPAAERVLESTAAEVVGADVGEVFDVSVQGLRNGTSITFQTTGSRALFEPTVSELTDQHGHCLGYAIVLRDVTARTTRQQRLEVLNRVLRHNLSNDMNVIIGHAELLQKNISDPTLTDSVGSIIRTVRELSRLSEEAREIDRVMATTDSDAEPVLLAPLTGRVLETVAADEDVTVESDVPADIVVEGAGDLLELALTNLVENAIDHNDAESPVVELRAEYATDRPYPVIVSVSDNGPGIPSEERRAIERGDETTLQHGSSLGLWVVRWVVTRLGGELAFENREPRGTTVSLRLPGTRRSEDETAPAADGARP